MAQIKSQKKRIKTNEKARKANSSYKSMMRTAMKKVVKACAENDLASAKTNLSLATSLIDKSVSKGIQHINTANRQKIALSTMVSSLEASQAK